MSSYYNISITIFISFLLTLILAFEGLVAFLLLEFGVVDLLVFGVVDLLDIDPVRKSGNLCGETVLFSIAHTC